MTLAGNPSSVEAAVEIIAARLLEGIQCPPTDLEAIRPRLNITQFCAEDIAGSGELQRDGDGLKVVYSPTLSPTRRRFTIAHECGHRVLHFPELTRLVCTPDDIDEIPAMEPGNVQQLKWRERH